ncbi:MAG: 30S ribosomal protein S27ae [Candidatus Woesearchaeota archaeon]|nr:30S ribosomal protein S27ae [Candidatus Woesearchaeota archaeon]
MAEAQQKQKKEPGAARSRISLYKIDGDSLKREGKFCPKCGPGIFMASHADRVTCGKCGYMEKQ